MFAMPAISIRALLHVLEPRVTALGFGVALVATLLAAPLAMAAPPTSPTLNPPPLASYTCSAVGTGTICRSHTLDVYSDDPTGIICGSGPDAVELLDNGTRDVHATRWYDRDGNIVRRLRTFLFDSYLSNPANGRTLAYAQHNTDNEVLAVPGDLDSITWSGHGHFNVTIPGYGAVIVEAGRTVIGPEGEVEAQSGAAKVDTEPICAFLAGP